MHTLRALHTRTHPLSTSLSTSLLTSLSTALPFVHIPQRLAGCYLLDSVLSVSGRHVYITFDQHTSPVMDPVLVDKFTGDVQPSSSKVSVCVCVCVCVCGV